MLVHRRHCCLYRIYNWLTHHVTLFTKKITKQICVAMSDGHMFPCLIVGYSRSTSFCDVMVTRWPLARALPADPDLYPLLPWCSSRVYGHVPMVIPVCLPPAAPLDRVVLQQSSRARVVMDDADGHLVYWPGYVMGDRCSWLQHIEINIIQIINKNITKCCSLSLCT